MSRKSKSKKRSRARAFARSPASVSSAPLPRALSASRVGGDQALVRSVEMSLGARNQVVKGSRGRMVVESSDPSIPLDRVPYFTSDLIRLALTAIAMVVLLAIGSFLVPRFVH